MCPRLYGLCLRLYVFGYMVGIINIRASPEQNEPYHKIVLVVFLFLALDMVDIPHLRINPEQHEILYLFGPGSVL